MPVQQPKSHYCWKTDSNYPFSSGVPYHINYIYPQLTVCCFRKILKILRGKKTFCHPLDWPSYTWLVLMMELCYLKILSHLAILCILLHKIFTFYTKDIKKNQTVKILYNSIWINPSINTCIPIHDYKNSRYIYMYNNSETKAVISSKLNQFLQIKQRLRHHLKLHYKHEYVGVLI